MLNNISSFVNHADDNGLFHVLSQVKNKMVLKFCHQQFGEVMGERVFSNVVVADILKGVSNQLDKYENNFDNCTLSDCNNNYYLTDL